MSVNPWLDEAEPFPRSPGEGTDEEVGNVDDDGAEASAAVLATGPAAPQPGQVRTLANLESLGLRPFTPTTDQLWVVGVHGGAGESTVAELLGAAATQRGWPEGSPSAAVLLAARTHAAGLEQLQAVATAWAAGALPPARLLGAVLVPDAPGRLPVPLAQRARLIGGGLPHYWFLDWDEQLRLGTAPVIGSRRLKHVRREISSLYNRKVGS